EPHQAIRKIYIPGRGVWIQEQRLPRRCDRLLILTSSAVKIGEIARSGMFSWVVELKRLLCLNRLLQFSSYNAVVDRSDACFLEFTHSVAEFESFCRVLLR